MNRSRTVVFAMAGFILAASISGCSQNPDHSSSGATASEVDASLSRPTLTASKLQPPAQHNQYTTKGRPEIVFDPCTWISDDTVRKSGFDPGSRKRGKDVIAEYSFLTCDFSSDTKYLMLNSGNATWEEDLQKVGGYSEPATINGRPALIVRDPALPETCQIDLKTKAGFVQITVDPIYSTSNSSDCSNLPNIASNIEKEIGKDN